MAPVAIFLVVQSSIRHTSNDDLAGLSALIVRLAGSEIVGYIIQKYRVLRLISIQLTHVTGRQRLDYT
jgi:hypothetical protein